MVHPVVPADVTEYVIVPLPDVMAPESAVYEPADNNSDVVGDHEIVCGANPITMLTVVDAAA